MMGKKQLRLVMRTSILAVLAIALTYTFYANFTKENNKAVAKNEPVPDFVLTDLDGNTHKLSDYKGQGVFLNFWGTWCGPCEREFPAMTQQYETVKDEGVQIIAVNFAQSDFEVKKYVQNMGMTFPVAIDKTKSVFTAYNIGPLPTSIFIKPDGEIERIVTGEMSEKQISNYLDSIKPE